MKKMHGRTLTGLLLMTLAWAVPAAAGPVTGEGLSLRAYYSLEMEYQTTQEGNGDPNASFDMDLFELLVTFRHEQTLLAAALDYVHGTETESQRGGIELGFAYVEHTLLGPVVLRAGKMLNAFGLYNEIHGIKSTYLSMKEPFVVYKPDKVSDIAFRYIPRWNVGVEAQLPIDTEYGRWVASVMTGNGENEETNPYEEDNDPRKDLTARLEFESTGTFDMEAAYYTDQLQSEAGSGHQHAASLNATLAAAGFLVSSELAYGDQRLPGQPEKVKQTGLLVELGYELNDTVVPFLQYGRLDAEQGGHSESADVYSAGASVNLWDNMYLKVDDVYVTGSKDNGKFADIGSRSYNEVRAALVGGF